jgi:hypothetical protein
MTIELYQEISLTRDFSEYGLRSGDIATLVDFVPHPSGGEQGCVLEVFNAKRKRDDKSFGESIKTIAVPISAIEVLRSDEILAVRILAKAS